MAEPVRYLGPAEIRELADELELRPSKTLGQNFVHDANTVRRIVAAAGLRSTDHVLEVGPGLGSLTLGLLAFMLEFIPFIGPIVASIPALILALGMGPEMAFWVAALYLVIQQVEGNVVQPIVQQRAVDLPPALLLFSIVVAGLVFGIVGIIFAAPLTVMMPLTMVAQDGASRIRLMTMPSDCSHSGTA